MYQFEGKNYHDDRLFLLDLTLTKQGGKGVWTLITRQNFLAYPPYHVDDFASEEEAVEYVKRVEPTTPLISLGGQCPDQPMPYDEYCDNLRAQGLLSCLEMQRLGRPGFPEVRVEKVDPRELEEDN